MTSPANGRRRRSLGLALALAWQAGAAHADDAVYGPTKAATPPLARGTAADPREDAETAAPTAPAKYPPIAGATGAKLEPRDKRGAPPYSATQADDGALWVPRVLFAPFYLASEYLVRRPLGVATVFAERHHLPEQFLYYSSFGTYATDHQILLLPSVDFEWGVRANAGAALSWTHPSNVLTGGFAAGGPDWLRFGLADREKLDPTSTLTARADYERRGDLRFWGIGPSSPARGYYFIVTRPSTSVTYERRLWRSSAIDASAGIREADFQGWSTNPPTVTTGVASGAIRTPPGFAGYALAAQRLAGALDSRMSRDDAPRDRGTDHLTPSGTGGRVEAHAEHAVELGRVPAEWIRFGGGAGIYADLDGHQHTLGLSASTELLQRFREADVPFLELVSLGGTEPMRAFRYYRLLGQSSLVAKVSYSWPIWTDLDAVTEAALGNVFGPDYDGFAARLLRGSFSVGLATTAARDVAFQILVGAGTRTIDDGFAIEQLRFVVGTGTSF